MYEHMFVSTADGMPLPSPSWAGARAVLVIAALVGVCVAVLLGTAGDDEWSRALLQYGSTEELRPLTLPEGYGYPTGPQDRWNVIWVARNKNQRIRFTVPGEYKLYCSIHPVLMSQVVKVR